LEARTLKRTAFMYCAAWAAVYCANHSAYAQCASLFTLSDYDRKLFVSAAYGQEAEVSAEFLASQGCNDSMLAALGKLGGKLRYSDSKVGYVLVALPKESLLDALDIPGVEDATITHIYSDDNFVPLADRKISPLPPIELPFPQVATTLPSDGPYFAADEAGLTALWKQHPEADGRGVRVAVVDGGIDLLHPALQKVTDKSGNLAPKVADIVPVATASENENWVQFGEPIQAINSTLTAAGRTWTVPSNGTYRFGIYERKLALGPEENSHTKKITIAVGVLWSEQQNRVWVDTDADGNFKNETPLADYATAHDVGFFGTKEGGNDNRIPFGVKIDSAKHVVYIAVANDGHGTFVAGPLAANRLTGGLFDGAAPNAQLVDVLFGVAKLPSILQAMARPDVDVVNRSGGIARYNDDGKEEFARRVLERAVAIYDKPFVCYCAGSNFFHVMDYASAAMLRRNRQASPPHLEAINSFVWFKPEGLVNTILAPSASLVTLSRYLPLELQWEDGRRHTYEDKSFDPPAPAGYGIGSNPSPTIPIISGVLADLISEARRTHTRYTTARLYQALTSSARVLPDFPHSEQGYGVVNAAAAWDQLAKMAAADDPANPELTSFSIARNEHEQLRPVNGFSEELSGLGGSLDGELWVTRRGGYSGGRDYSLKLRSDDGTFTLLDTKATLVRNQAVRVRFKAKASSKWHVAFLQLIDTKADAVMEEVPLSIQAPDAPETVEPHVEKYQANIPPRREDREYVRLGADVQAASFSMQIPYEGPEGISGRYMPPRFGNYNAAKPNGEALNAEHHVGPIESFSTLAPNAKPETHEVTWENRGFHAEYETPYDPPAPDVPIHGMVTVAKYAVQFTKNDDQSLHVINQLAGIEGRTELYDATLIVTTMHGEGVHATAGLERNLPAHLAQWRVSVSSKELVSGLADVFLLNCTGDNHSCSVAAQQSLGEKGAVVSVDDPKEGTWRVLIRTRETVGRPVSYAVREASLTLAAMPIQTQDEKYATGATWSVALPAKQNDAQYVAFRIAGTSGKDDKKKGLRIALTALTTDAP
jgi:hypothetical protein